MKKKKKKERKKRIIKKLTKPIFWNMFNLYDEEEQSDWARG
mgnify:CR=1 FL=1